MLLCTFLLYWLASLERSRFQPSLFEVLKGRGVEPKLVPNHGGGGCGGGGSGAGRCSIHVNSCQFLPCRRVLKNLLADLETAEIYPEEFSTFVKMSEID